MRATRMRWNSNYMTFFIMLLLKKLDCQMENIEISFLPQNALKNFQEAASSCDMIAALLPSVALKNSDIYAQMVQVAHMKNLSSFWLNIRQWQLGKFLFLDNSAPTDILVHPVDGNCSIFDIYNPNPIRAIECNRQYPGYICRDPYEQKDCREDQGYFRVSNGCFYISRSPESWFVARNECDKKGLILASFTSSQAFKLKEYLKENKSSNLGQLYWIGLRRIDYSLATDLHKTTESSFVNLAYWINKQPIVDKKKLCVVAVLTKQGYNWTAEDCLTSHPVICEVPSPPYESTSVHPNEDKSTSTGTASTGFKQVKSTDKQENIPNIIRKDQLAMPPWIIVPTVLLLLLLAVGACYILKRYWRQRRNSLDTNNPRRNTRINFELDTEKQSNPLLRQVRQSESLPVFNILLVGLMNAGKSTLINSCIMAINNEDRCKEYALRGARRKDSTNQALRPYNVADCISKSFPLAEESHNKWSIKRCIPVFWELPSLPEEDEKDMRRILKRLSQGGLRPGEDISGLKRRHFCAFNYSKIHIIVFVHALTDKLPTTLVQVIYESVKNMRKTKDPDVPVLVVLTKKDLVEEEDKSDEIIAELNEELGVTSEKCFVVSLYCKETCGRDLPRNPDIDRDLNVFWESILDLSIGRMI